MANSWNGPQLGSPIRTDVPELQKKLIALLKQDPTSVANIPSGAKRLVNTSGTQWQVQQYNGSSWAAIDKMMHDVDKLDGYHAAITPNANTVAVRNANKQLEGDITGNAATASSAATLSQTLPVNKGGTGATTSEAARSNLGVPPTSHASTATTYGVGNSTQYGHLKLSDATDSASGVSGGVAATPAAAKAARDAADAAQSAADNAQSSADAAMTKASTLATATTPGIVKPGTGMTVDAEGELSVDAASTSKAGIVQLNNTVASTSTTQAATANAVKMAYDKGEEAKSVADSAIEALSTIVKPNSYVIKTWKSSDGSSWYIKWSDGFIQQGGVIKNIDSSWHVAVVNLPTPFLTNYYTISVSGISYTRTDESNIGTLQSKTKSMFKHSFYNNISIDPSWYACGY